MKNPELCKTILRRDEGLRLERYRCSQGTLTIGYGHAHGYIPDTCTLERAEQWLDSDTERAERDARALVPDFDSLSDNRQIVLVCMAFQLGITKMRKFVNTLQAVNEGRWKDAAKGMLNSLWAKQTPKRVKRLAAMMEVG